MKQSKKLLQNIRSTREAKKFTQEYMAEKMGLSVTGYAKIERGESKINYDRLEQIADVLEVNIGDLIPLADDTIFVFNHSNNDNADHVFIGGVKLEAEIFYLQRQLSDKEKIIESLEREIVSLNNQIGSLNKIIELIENQQP